MTDFGTENPDCDARRLLRHHRYSDRWLGWRTNDLPGASDW